MNRIKFAFVSVWKVWSEAISYELKAELVLLDMIFVLGIIDWIFVQSYSASFISALFFWVLVALYVLVCFLALSDAIDQIKSYFNDQNDVGA